LNDLEIPYDSPLEDEMAKHKYNDEVVGNFYKLNKQNRKMSPKDRILDRRMSELPREETEEDICCRNRPKSVYSTPERTRIDFKEICDYLQQKEISCVKYNNSLEKRYQNQDHYIATLQLSECGKKLIFYNLKPNEYQAQEGNEEPQTEELAAKKGNASTKVAYDSLPVDKKNEIIIKE